VVSQPSAESVTVRLMDASLQRKTFTFDRVFGPEVSQSDGGGVMGRGGGYFSLNSATFEAHVPSHPPPPAQIFEEVGGLVTSALDGFGVAVVAYGATGAGKTHTMEGPPHDRGINYRALRRLFELRNEREASVRGGGDLLFFLILTLLLGRVQIRHPRQPR
jgi:hypothetical protein